MANPRQGQFANRCCSCGLLELPNRAFDRAYVYVPTLEELFSETVPPRKQPRETRIRPLDRSNSDVFSDEEDISLPKLPKKVKKPPTKKKKKAAKRR
jgi:hypothetical protein